MSLIVTKKSLLLQSLSHSINSPVELKKDIVIKAGEKLFDESEEGNGKYVAIVEIDQRNVAYLQIDEKALKALNSQG